MARAPRCWPLLALAALTPGCGGGKAPAAASDETPVATDWRSVATPQDRRRIRDWRSSWLDALASARAAGKGGEIDAEGALLDPDAGSGSPYPAPGDYRCRVVKVGAQASGLLPLVAYPAFACRVSGTGAAIRLEKLTGSQRPQGILYTDNGSRLIFLGTMVLGDERGALGYGRDRQRDMAGVFERIGPKRWRLALPQPAWESLLDVVEFVPAG